MQTNLELEGLNVENVTCWDGRPKRHKQRPVTYWEQYVETDEWYKKKLVEDVPLDEMYAAVEDENFEEDEGEEEEGEEEEGEEEDDSQNFPSEDEDYEEECNSDGSDGSECSTSMSTAETCEEDQDV